MRLPNINLEKLKKYIIFQIKVRKREDGREVIYKAPMIPCTVEMFAKNNYEFDDKAQEWISKRLCPDIEAMKDYWILRNGYTNGTDRSSFNVQVVLCDD